MIELRFGSEDDAMGAMRALSSIGDVRFERRLESEIDRKYFLTMKYEESVEELKEVSAEIEDEINPAEHLLKALEIAKSLFESGEYMRFREVRYYDEAESKLLEVVDELKGIRELKEETNRYMGRGL